MELKNTIKQVQTQTLTPQMLQSIEILQMNTQELTEYLQDQTLSNPLLELKVPDAAREKKVDLLAKARWLREQNRPGKGEYRAKEDSDETSEDSWVLSQATQETLSDHLLHQLNALKLNPRIETAARFLIMSLDRRGWLSDNLVELAQEGKYRYRDIEQALRIVQSLDPAGVGARNLSECLCLQYEREEEPDQIVFWIIREGLELMARKRYDRIAFALSVTQEEVKAACKKILRLNPKPGNGFASGEIPQYIVPDLFVLLEDGDLRVVLNDQFPELHLNTSYIDQFAQADDQELQNYLADQLRKANWLIENVSQRKKTLLACAENLVKRQEAFFCMPDGAVKPLTMMEIAKELDLHESTVSRAMKGKYLQCRRGMFPLSAFFSRALPGGTDERTESAFTAENAKILLRSLVSNEDPSKPFSDQKLSELMAEKGCDISRRTVAKYRDALGIPGTSVRRRR